MPRDEARRRKFFNEFYPRWHRYELENYAAIKKSFEKKDSCIHALKSRKRVPAIVTGAGVSLERALPLLKDWKYPIFAGVTNAYAIIDHGRIPEYINVCDSSSRLATFIRWRGWSIKTKLITHPHVFPDVLKFWDGDMYFYRQMFPGEEFFEYHFPKMFPYIRYGLNFRGCVANTCVQLAIAMNYDPIYLVGIDYGWKDPAKTRVDMYLPDAPDGSIVKVPATNEYFYKGKPGKEVHVHGPTNTRYFTSETQFPRYLSELTDGCGSKIIDCSNGRVDWFPKEDIRKVIHDQK